MLIEEQRAEEQPEEMSSDQAAKIAEAVKGVVWKLSSEAQRRVGQKANIEDQWLEDLRQYHGRYESVFESRLREAAKTDNAQSNAFMNRTRTKTRAMAARLKEMLFPADDSSWDIDPTPMPQLASAAEMAAQKVAAENVPKDENGNPVEVTEAQQIANKLAANIAEANTRRDAMKRVIDDDLTECGYDQYARKVIDDAAKIGTGVMKGPIQSTSRRAGWREAADGSGFTLEMTGQDKPEYRRVDPWSFFPDPEAQRIEDSEGDYERHLLNARQMRALARNPGFLQDGIRECLKAGPNEAMPSYLQSLRDITEDTSQERNYFHVWEYTGSLEAEDIATIAMAIGDNDTFEEMQEADPLEEMRVIIWFCGNEVLKFGIYPLDSFESLFSVFCLEEAEGTIWGKGIPRIMRDSQSALNAGWRAMLDNGGYALGPHIVVNDSKVQPENGVWDFKGPKLWRLEGTMAAGERAFEQFQVDMNQEQLAGIIALADKFIDDETGMPKLSTGDGSDPTTKTVGGMALLMSQGNLVFREIVRRFDDDFTIPNIRRCYDWEMQFSDRNDIKGDYKIKARGVSALLMREIEAQNLLMVASVYGVDDPDIKADVLKRAVLRALMLDPDEFLRTTGEREKFITDNKPQGPTEAEMQMEQNDLRRAEIEMKFKVAQLESQARMSVAETQNRTAMMTLAENMNMKIEEIEAMMQRERMKADASERRLAVEIADKRATGVGAGGSV